MNQKLKERITEPLSSVLSVTCIVLIPGITIIPIPLGPPILLPAGAVFPITGTGFSTLGAGMAMISIGEKVGVQPIRAKKLPVIIIACIIIGAMATVAEPDLQALARQTLAVPGMVFILTVTVGIDLFLALASLRSLFGWNPPHVLLVRYIILFILAFYIPDDFLAVTFDPGDMTAGPITVPLIMALGVGSSSIGQGKNADSNSFGLVPLCSIGSILSAIALGPPFQSSSGSYGPMTILSVSNSQDPWPAFQSELPHYAAEVSTALFLILAFSLLLQAFFLKMRRRQMVKILVGMLYPYIGLTLSLTGISMDFMSTGSHLGKQTASPPYCWILVSVVMLTDYYIVKTKSAAQMLNKQVTDAIGGSISEKTTMTGLSVGMALLLGLSLFRVVTGLPPMAFLLPGHVLTLRFSSVVLPTSTSIVFDSRGIISGPMIATFLLPLCMGACGALGSNILTDVFGIVATVVMTPLIIIRLTELPYELKTCRGKAVSRHPMVDMNQEFTNLEGEPYEP